MSLSYIVFNVFADNTDQLIIIVTILFIYYLLNLFVVGLWQFFYISLLPFCCYGRTQHSVCITCVNVFGLRHIADSGRIHHFDYPGSLLTIPPPETKQQRCIHFFLYSLMRGVCTRLLGSGEATIATAAQHFSAHSKHLGDCTFGIILV